MKNLPAKAWFVDYIDTGKSFISMKIYNGRVGVRSEKDLKGIDNKNPNYLKFIGIANYVKGSVTKFRETFDKLEELVQQKMDHEAVHKDTWEETNVFGTSI